MGGILLQGLGLVVASCPARLSRAALLVLMRQGLGLWFGCCTMRPRGLCRDAAMVLVKQWLGLGLFWQSERRGRAFVAVLIELGGGGASSLMRHSRLCRACTGNATVLLSHNDKRLAVQIKDIIGLLVFISRPALATQQTSLSVV